MHLLVPFAADPSAALRSVLDGLELPNLTRFLAASRVASRLEGDAQDRTPPHEHALAVARGWQGADGRWPFAAAQAAADGLDVSADGSAWALVTPCHWALGRESAVLADPARLGLDEPASRALHAVLADAFAAADVALVYAAPARWYARHADLSQVATASLDRAVGRPVHDWQPSPDDDADAPDPLRAAAMRRTLARLQSEAQLAWHEHPANEARERDGRPAVNSFWVSGGGAWQPVDPGREPVVHDGLRDAALAGDAAAWADAWRALDAGPIARLVDASTPVTLTLCGERHAEQHVRDGAGSAWQRWRRRRNAPAPRAVLGSL